MNKLRASLLFLFTFLVSQSGTRGADNLIVNGSFELGKFNTPSFERILPGQTDIVGWEVGGMGVDRHVGTAAPDVNPNFRDPHIGPASDGSLVMDLNLDGVGSGWIQQTFNTVPGVAYKLSFQMAAADWFSDPRSVTVSVNETAYNYFVPGSDPNDLQWYEISFRFIASSSRTTLRFSSPDNSGFWGPIIDDVQVYPNDTTPPVVVRCVPVLINKTFVGIEYDFSESVNPLKGALSKTNYEWISSGPDCKFGTTDDIKLNQYSIIAGKNRIRHRARIEGNVDLSYPMRFTIFRSGVFDRSGNQMPKDFVMYLNKAAGRRK